MVAFMKALSHVEDVKVWSVLFILELWERVAIVVQVMKQAIFLDCMSAVKRFEYCLSAYHVMRQIRGKLGFDQDLQHG